MLVVVNQPHINDFKIEGSISPITLDNLKNMFGNYLKVEEEDDEWVDFRDTDWFKEIEASRTPSVNLKFYRSMIEKRFQKLWQRNSQRFSMSLFLGLFKKAKTGRFDRSF